MAKNVLGITRKRTREEELIKVRNEIVKNLFRAGFSYGEISQIANIDKGGAFRIVKNGRNISTPKRST
jgi:hypothetical protein